LGFGVGLVATPYPQERTVRLDTGETIEFERKPSLQDISEVYNKIYPGVTFNKTIEEIDIERPGKSTEIAESISMIIAVLAVILSPIGVYYIRKYLK